MIQLLMNLKYHWLLYKMKLTNPNTDDPYNFIQNFINQMNNNIDPNNDMNMNNIFNPNNQINPVNMMNNLFNEKNVHKVVF